MLASWPARLKPAPIPATRSVRSGATAKMKAPVPAEMSDNLRNKRALAVAQGPKPAITGKYRTGGGF